MTIGNRIKSRRKQLNLTQEDIFVATKITPGNLSNIERGKIHPSSTTLIALSQILQCSADWILTGSEISQEAICLDLLSPDEIELIQKYRALPRSAQKEVRNFINFPDEIELIQKYRSLSKSGKRDVRNYIEFEIVKKINLAKSSLLDADMADVSKNIS